MGVVVENSTLNNAKSANTESVAAVPKLRMVTKRIRFRRTTAPKSSHLKSPWLKGRRRPMYRKVVVYIDEHGKEVAGPETTKAQKASGRTASVGGNEKKQKSDAGQSGRASIESVVDTDCAANNSLKSDSPPSAQKKRSTGELANNNNHVAKTVNNDSLEITPVSN
jgi:hypothetical protein